MHREELSRQGGDQVCFRDGRKRHHEVRHGQCNPAGESAFCQSVVQEAVRIPGERHEQMLHSAEPIERRRLCVWMTRARCDGELLFVQHLRVETGRYVGEGHDCDIDRAGFQLVQRGLPGALECIAPLRREKLPYADIDMRSAAP